jgi:hypothetical protein
MKRKMLLLLSALGWSGGVIAADISLSADAGYRVDRFGWTIAGDVTGGNPNILSELVWHNMNIAQARLGMEAQLSRFHLRMRGGYGKARDGDNRDSDYLSDDRADEFSRSDNRGDGQFVDGSVALGYQFDFVPDGPRHMHLLPLIGYAVNRQEFVMSEGYQTIPALGSFNGLKSTYDAEWAGPWVGVSWWETDNSRDLTVSLDLEYHSPDYDAVANWNLRDDFAHPTSFQHWADGHGVVVSLNSSYGLTKSLALIFGLDFRSWDTDAGLDRVYRANGTTLDTQFNGANWDSYAINLGLALNF